MNHKLFKPQTCPEWASGKTTFYSSYAALTWHNADITLIRSQELENRGDEKSQKS